MMRIQLNYTVIKRPEALENLANKVEGAHIVGIDLETEGFDPMRGRIRLVSLNIDGFCCVIDLFETQTFEPLCSALKQTNAIFVGQNLKFDQKWLWYHHKLRLRKIFDTMRASYIYYNGLDRRHDLYSLYDRELDCDPIVKDLGASNWSGPLTQEQYDYAAEDITMLPLLRDALRKKLIKDGLTEVGLREMAVVFPEARMELNGFRVDGKLWQEQAEEARLKEYEMRLQLLRQMPAPGKQGWLFSNEAMAQPLLDPVSFEDDESDEEEPEDDNTTLAKIFRDRMPKKKRGKKEFFNVESNKHVLASLQKLDLRDDEGKLISSTSEIVLAGFASRYPIIKDLLAHREWATRLKMFGNEYLKFINPVTGRIHGNLFAFTGAGRYAMRSPNLLQLPRSKTVRKCFKPLPKKKLIIADLSQAELRIMAQLSKDHELIQAYANGVDIHTQTAEMLTGLNLATLSESERKAKRQLAKAVNFGLIYGLGAAKFVLYARASYGVTVSLKEAEEIIRKFFAFYKGIKKWQQQVQQHLKPTGEVWTLGKRRRFLDPVKDHNAYYNTPDQGTGADGLKEALIAIQDLLDTKYEGRAILVLSVHDEIILEADDDEELLKELLHDLERVMAEGLGKFVTVVPVLAEGGYGTDWASKN